MSIKKAMILAAGRGLRMMPLTKDIPKPLIKIDKYTLIEHNIFKLKKAGILDIVINIAYLPEKIIHYLGDGSKYDMNFLYSKEPYNYYSTGGGIKKAIDFLGDEFVVVNSDIFHNYDLKKLQLPQNKLANIVLVDNPQENTKGDFFISDRQVILLNKSIKNTPSPKTFSGISIYKKDFFMKYKSDKIKINLADMLSYWSKNGLVSGEYYQGIWVDVGTPERLKLTRKYLL